MATERELLQEIIEHQREIDDRHQIHEVMLRYCRGTDRLDVELLETVFHDDAKVVYAKWTGSGKDVVPGVLDTTMNLARDKMAMHSIFNHYARIDGDVANSETYFVCWGLSGDNPEQLAERGGRYLDRFERRNGEWRIAERLIVWDWGRKTAMPAPFSDGNTRGYRSTDDPSYRFLPQVG